MEEFILAELPKTRGKYSGGREKAPNEVRWQVERAYARKYISNGATTPRIDAKPFDPELMCRVASRVPIEITYDWLAKVSPMSVSNVTSSQFLDALFLTGEFVPIKRRDNDYGFPYHVGNPESPKKLNEYVQQNENGAWFHTCPTNGKYNVIQEPDAVRTGACYADKLITAWRYLLLESDEKRFQQEWLKILVRLRQRVVALYTSGNVSVHALVRVDAKSKEEFTKIADRFKRLVPFGACGGSLTALRATRLPGVIRTDNFAYQRLLYLAPNADGRPIYQ